VQGQGQAPSRPTPPTGPRTGPQTAERKQDKAAEALALFAAQHPAEWAWIESSRAGFAFAQSMHDAIAKFGDLTERQLAACASAAAKSAVRRAEWAAQKVAAQAVQQGRLEAAPVVSMDKIMAAFAAAKASGLKAPKLRVAGLVIKPAKAESANAGFLYVMAGGDLYLGKISPEGRFLRSAACRDEDEAKLLEIAADPLAAAVAYGKETGTCSCCGLELTNKLSIELGIGPICRAKWGMG
jgi:hypothetical protein